MIGAEALPAGVLWDTMFASKLRESRRDILEAAMAQRGTAYEPLLAAPELVVVGAEGRRPHEEDERGRHRGERGLAAEREPVGERENLRVGAVGGGLRFGAHLCISGAADAGAQPGRGAGTIGQGSNG